MFPLVLAEHPWSIVPFCLGEGIIAISAPLLQSSTCILGFQTFLELVSALERKSTLHLPIRPRLIEIIHLSILRYFSFVKEDGNGRLTVMASIDSPRITSHLQACIESVLAWEVRMQWTSNKLDFVREMSDINNNVRLEKTKLHSGMKIFSKLTWQWRQINACE